MTGYIILEQEKVYPLFSGHNTVCVAVAVIELGMVEAADFVHFKLEAPGGIVDIEAKMTGKRVDSISMVGMKSFVEKQDLSTNRKEILDLIPVNPSDGTGIKKTISNRVTQFGYQTRLEIDN